MTAQEPTAPQPQSSTPDAVLVNLVDLAVREYQHAESIVQSRLYNFLFADSILILSWAALFSASPRPAGARWVLGSLALLSTLLSFFWTLMGWRHRKFLYLHTHIVRSLEDKLTAGLRVHDLITQLQEGSGVQVGMKGRQHTLQLSNIELFARSRNLGVLAPFCLMVVSTVLLGASFA
jgi:hypothetical protein